MDRLPRNKFVVLAALDSRAVELTATDAAGAGEQTYLSVTVRVPSAEAAAEATVRLSEHLSSVARRSFDTWQP